MAKQRDPVLDSMRGIGIVLMVLGHSGFPGTDFIYLFHMALFFMLSGWLFSLRGGPVQVFDENGKELTPPASAGTAPADPNAPPPPPSVRPPRWPR